MELLLFLLAITPGLLICVLIFNMDKYEKEPKMYLAVCFVLGIFCTLPAINIERLGQRFVHANQGQFFKIFIFTTLVIGLTEELLKFLALVMYAYPRKVFNEPLDGIIYAVMVSMGFATLENILYGQANGFTTLVARAFTAVPAHAIFAVAMGFFVGKAKFEDNPKQKALLLLKGLLLSVVIHGIYDFLLMQGEFQILMVMATMLVLVGVFYGQKYIEQQQAISPFRDDYNEVLSVNELAISDRLRFVQDKEIIDAMLHKMDKKEDLPERWAEVYNDSESGDKWLKFNVSSSFSGDAMARFMRMPGPSTFEIINLIFTTEHQDEILSAAEYLRLREYYHQEFFRENLINHLEEFDTENLSDVHREHISILILETQLNNPTFGNCSNAHCERAHRLLMQISV
jgi:protease PrsW